MPRLNIITKRMYNHADHSGYDRLIDYIDAQCIYEAGNFGLLDRMIARTCRSYIKRAGLEWYHRDSFIQELKAGTSWLMRQGQIFHFLYGENSYRYLGNLKKIKSGNAIVSTYHTPPDKFQKVVRSTNHLKHVDALITVSTMQMDYFSEIIGQDRIYFVPHGIDVDYYQPASVTKLDDKPFRCLFVGSHLRDFETLMEVGRLLEKERNEYQITAVVTPRNITKLSQAGKNINVRTQLTDSELLALYQESDLLLLPLLGSTANNSLLEAMACGLPVLSTDIDGVKDYVNQENAILVKKGDARSLADNVIALSNEENTLSQMSKASREKALQFRWENVASQLYALYGSLF